MNASSYQLKRSHRARTVRITVHPGGSVTVTAPLQLNESAITAFVSRKSDWIKRTIKKQQRHKPSVLPPATRAHYREHKEQARTVVQERLIEINRHYGYTFGRISIRNQKHLWGSCSKTGNLNFNYRILFLPPALRDYIIAHELCHRKEMNHSARFWSLVRRAIPEPHTLRREFRRQGYTLG